MPTKDARGHYHECESRSHGACRGDLWKCEGCGKIICEEEGGPTFPNLCDDCYQSYGKQNGTGK